MTAPRRTSQEFRALQLMLRGRALTPEVARREFGSDRLASRINRLKSEYGWGPYLEKETVSVGDPPVKVAQYRINLVRLGVLGRRQAVAAMIEDGRVPRAPRPPPS